ncbi:MAG: 30S ribosomal protein S8 [Acidobacteriota bacterium]|nr:MAG: 30S ribosomal protein S8 [Acidobacteriota bacterium]
MSVTDPIADFLTRIRNAHMAFHETVNIPHSRTKEAIARILREEGYIASYSVDESQQFKVIAITLKYLGDREPAIRRLARISKPGRRVYVGRDDIPSVLGGLGVNVLSTSKGVLSGKRARSEGVGGELLFEVY